MHMWLLLLLMLLICWLLWRQALRGHERVDRDVLFVVIGIALISAHVIAAHAVVVTVAFVWLLLLLLLLMLAEGFKTVVVAVIVAVGASCWATGVVVLHHGHRRFGHIDILTPLLLLFVIVVLFFNEEGLLEMMWAV